MRIKYSLTLAAIWIFGIALCGGARAQSSISDLGWLAGCWGGEVGGREYSEQWMRPGGNTMLGTSRTVANGKTVAYEFIQIRQEETGDLYYVAKPSDQKEASFKLLRVNPRELIFENRAHDFPQRIIYRFKKKGSLLARIEGLMDGKEKSIDFPMKRVRCEVNRPGPRE